MSAYTLESLEVYQLAEDFSDRVWAIVTEWSYYLKQNIGSQLTRAADSISANIAEGYGRHYYGESKNFYFYSRGSLLECKSWIGKCQRRKLINEEVCNELLQQLELILAKLINYIKFVQRSQKAVKSKKAEA